LFNLHLRPKLNRRSQGPEEHILFFFSSLEEAVTVPAR